MTVIARIPTALGFPGTALHAACVEWDLPLGRDRQNKSFNSGPVNDLIVHAVEGVGHL